MTFALPRTERCPMREDAAGCAARRRHPRPGGIGRTGVPGRATPETIVQRYSTLALADVYAVVTYYLRHRSEVEEYLCASGTEGGGSLVAD